MICVHDNSFGQPEKLLWLPKDLVMVCKDTAACGLVSCMDVISLQKLTVMVGPSVKAKLLGLTSSRSTSEALPVLEGADAFVPNSACKKRKDDAFRRS